MYDGNTEEIAFGLSHCKVSVHEGSSYQDFSVVHFFFASSQLNELLLLHQIIDNNCESH